MHEHYCPHCLRLTAAPVCEHCGKNTLQQNDPHQLPVGTLLQGQYRIGKVLGQGGFGITYLGWDIHLNIPLAIKEYFPTSMVMRECTTSLEVFTYGGDSAVRFQNNKERFLREAKALAQLSHIPHIVKIRSFFLENNTAYIIMEYVQGTPLNHYVKDQGGTLSPQETFRILTPIMEALEQVHKSELVHRDISPDNIMLLPDGSAKLLDFGAVRDVGGADANTPAAASTETILKLGYAPIEQYQRRGSLGPWTDVYALCATMYYCMTGEVPPEAPERMMGTTELNWAKDVPQLTSAQASALEKGMAPRAKDRTLSVGALMEDLFPGTAVKKPKVVGGSGSIPPKWKLLKFLPVALAIIVLAAAAILSGRFLTLPTPETVPETETSLPAEAMAPWEENRIKFFQEVSISYSFPTITNDADAEMGNSPVFGSRYKRRHIRSVTFLDTLAGMPEDAWDISENADGSVMAWVTPAYELVIAGEGGVYARGTAASLFAGFLNLEEVHFNGALHINSGLENMFFGCSSLKKVDLTELDLSYAFNMDRMFYCCESLREVRFPQSESPYLSSISSMFAGCSRLTRVDLSGLDTSAVTNMQGLFSGCTNLQEVNLTGLDTRSVTDMSYLFYECSNLQSVDLSSFDTGNVTTMSYMFRRCSALTELDIRSFDTTRVEFMNSMFEMCESLEVLDLSHFQTPRLTDMMYMFDGCTALRELDLSNFDTSGVSSMILLFCGCEALEKLDISSFDTSGVTDMRHMFERCDKLFDLDLSHFDTSNVAQYEGFTTNNRLVKGRNWQSLFR